MKHSILKNNLFHFLLIFFLISTLIFSFAKAEGGVPSVLSYQGRLTDSSGNLLGNTGTPYFFKFSFWDSATVGTGSQVWPVLSPSSVSLTVKQGVFNVNLGDTENGYPDILNYNFNTNKKVYLQIEVSSNNSSFETLSPRQRITSSAFAEIAGQVNGVGQSSFGTTTPIDNSIVTIQSTSSASTALTLLASTGQLSNIFNIFDSNNNSIFSINNSGGLLANYATTTNFFSNYLNSTNSSFENSTSTNLFASNFKLSNLNGLLFGDNGVISSVSTSSIFSNYYNKVQSDSMYDLLGSATSSITNHENLFNHNLIATALQSFTESDPIFMSASTSLNYIKTETDPFYTSSSWSTTTNNSINWNTAFGWGSHTGLYDLLGAASTTASSTLSNWLVLNPTSGINTGDNATNIQYSGLATSKQNTLNGTGFIKASGTSITYDNNIYLTAETDPLFTAWDKHAGISVTESQISDLKSYLIGESDTLATITARGASTSVESTFSGGLVTNKIRPVTDSSTAIQITKADGITSVLNVDTTNGMVGIGTTTPTHALTFSASSTGIVLHNQTDQTTNTETGFARWVGNSFQIGTGKSGSGTARGLEFFTGGVSRFTLTGAGDYSPTTDNTLFMGLSSKRFHTAYFSNTINLGNGSTPEVKLLASGVSYFNGGNVGIGTKTPDSPLTVVGRMKNTVSSAGENIAWYTGVSRPNTSGDSAVWKFYTNTAGTADFFGKVGYKFQGGTNDASKQFQIHIADDTNPKMIINGSGNVGIGTTGPETKLDVTGAAVSNRGVINSTNNTFSNGVDTPTINSRFFTTNSSTVGSMSMGKFGGANNGVGLRFQQEEGVDRLIFRGSSTAGAMVWSQPEAGAQLIIDIPTRAFRFTDSVFSPMNETVNLGGNSTTTRWKDFYTTNAYVTGNVGIGTTTPSAKLHVTGTVGATDIFAISSSTNLRLFTVSANGNVGIGTSTPIYPLSINATSSYNTGLSITGNINSFFQGNIQNTNSSAGASSDWVATADNGNDTTHYIDMGINNSGGGISPFVNANETYLYSASDSLNIGALGTGSIIKFHTGGNNTTPAVTFDNVGNVAIGTTTTSALLTINDPTANAEAIRILGYTGSNIVSIGQGSNRVGTLSLKSSASTKTFLTANGVSYFTGGSLGLGTSDPTANFQVAQVTAGVGTVSVGAGGTVWTGVGTEFLNTFKAGDTITSSGQTLTIQSVNSDTSLTTDAVGAGISAKAYTLSGGTRFSVLGNGNVGIGTTTPSQSLSVVGNAQFTAVGSGTSANDLRITADGTLTTSASDISLKMNLVPLNISSTSVSVLDKVIGLKPYTYNWKSDPDGIRDIGLIAQDVENIFPEITFTNKTDGYKGINYSRLPVILVSAIQELNDKLIQAGSYVVDGVASFVSIITDKFVANEADIKNIKTEKICLGETCIDEQSLKDLLQKNSIATVLIVDGQTGGENSTSTATSTEEEIATSTTTTTDNMTIQSTSTEIVLEEISTFTDTQLGIGQSADEVIEFIPVVDDIDAI